MRWLASIKEHEEVTKIKNITKIECGRFTLDTWYDNNNNDDDGDDDGEDDDDDDDDGYRYFSPFPKDYYPEGVTDVMYICEFCLSFYIHRSEYVNHICKCKNRCPPGQEVRNRCVLVLQSLCSVVKKDIT